MSGIVPFRRGVRTVASEMDLATVMTMADELGEVSFDRGIGGQHRCVIRMGHVFALQARCCGQAETRAEALTIAVAMAQDVRELVEKYAGLTA